jgi:hypothetical protein
MKDDTDYRREALDDAWGVIENNSVEIAANVADGATVHDNDEPIDDDIRECQTNVYGLKVAAEILDQLSDHEETDNGLWESLPPRKAIESQAHYTYVNAVRHEVSSILDDLSGHIDAVEDSLPEGAGDLDGWKAAVARMYCEFGQIMDGEDCDIKSLLLGVFDELKSGQTAGLIAAKDWMRENAHDFRVSTLDAILAHVPEPDEVEADE